MNSRPVELPKLDKPEFDVSSLVLQEGLLHTRHPFLDLLNRGELEFGDVYGAHDERSVRSDYSTI
jgi:hypothetical protein